MRLSVRLVLAKEHEKGGTCPPPPGSNRFDMLMSRHRCYHVVSFNFFEKLLIVSVFLASLKEKYCFVPKWQHFCFFFICFPTVLIKVTPTSFWLKCKHLPKCTKFCSTSKLEVAAKNFGVLTKNCLMHWQIRGLKGSISGNNCVVCLNL